MFFLILFRRIESRFLQQNFILLSKLCTLKQLNSKWWLTLYMESPKSPPKPPTHTQIFFPLPTPFPCSFPQKLRQNYHLLPLCHCVHSPSSRYGLTKPTWTSHEVSGTYPSVVSRGTGSSTTVIVEPFQVSMMRRPLSEVTRVHCFLRRVRGKLWISSVKDCMAGGMTQGPDLNLRRL